MAARTVTLYSRKGCHLCDDARALLQRLAPGLGFEVEEIDIESDDALHQRYMFEIPVVVYEGRQLASAPIVPLALEDALREAMAR